MSGLPTAPGPVRPAEVCQALLVALEAAEGRLRRHSGETTADAIGIAIKRELLERAVREDPDPDVFEGWLLGCCLARGAVVSAGAIRAIARGVLEEWRLAQAVEPFPA